MKAFSAALRVICAVFVMMIGLLIGALTLVLPGQFDPTAMAVGMLAMIAALHALALAAQGPRSRTPLVLCLGYTLVVVSWMISAIPLPPGDGERLTLALLSGVAIQGLLLGVLVLRRRAAVGLTVATLGAVFALNALLHAILSVDAMPAWGPASALATALGMSAYAAMIASFLLCLRWYRANSTESMEDRSDHVWALDSSRPAEPTE